jgi:orotidine-5'-phosphate decarboxylase
MGSRRVSGFEPSHPIREKTGLNRHLRCETRRYWDHCRSIRSRLPRRGRSPVCTVAGATERGAGIYVLVKTSNPGSASFQDQIANGATIFQHVARMVEDLALETSEAGFGCVGAVVGATYPRELTELRTAMPHVPLLIPGYGSQGGAADDVSTAFHDDGLGAVINNSRGINFAYKAKTYAEEFGPRRWEAAAEAATKQMIEDLAAHTSAGKLQYTSNS